MLTQAMCFHHWSPANSTTPGHYGNSGAALSNRNDSWGLSLEVLLPAEALSFHDQTR